MANRKGISSFSVLLLMIVAAVVGMASISRLKVQYTPPPIDRHISISFHYPGASARIVESEVTSKLEKILSNISGCTYISSISKEGEGAVILTLDKHVEIEDVRLAVATQIRNCRTYLPENCSYPSISLNTLRKDSRTVIAFDIRSPLPSKDIAHFVNEHIIFPLSSIDGVGNVEFFGQTPFELVITFDADAIQTLGISASDLCDAIRAYYADEVLGTIQSGENIFGVKIRSGSATSSVPDFSSIPVIRAGNRIIYLNDIASFRYQESLPNSYYRINGLNTLILTVEAESNANILSVVKDVKERMGLLQKSFPEEIVTSVSYDYSEYISEELDKLYFRTIICILLLLLFVIIVNRSWRYMTVIALTLTVNILISIAAYFLLGLSVHIYTLAGITVSLGIIIDNSIIMIDHWVRHKNRGVFPDLLVAVLTTIVALLAILLLPEREKANLTDFSLVIIINLCISLAVAFLFVPALLDYFPTDGHRKRRYFPKSLRRIAKFNICYEKYINWGLRHRWMLVIVFLVLFGIPTFLLPDEFGDKTKAQPKGYERVLNKIVGWHPYADNRFYVDKILGSSFSLFNNALSHSNFYKEPSRNTLNISAGMPDGCSVQQLNEVIISMENYLTDIEEIESFETHISSANNGRILVYFKPEVEDGWIPNKIKSDIISMANNFGGANWIVSGLDDNNFNNNIVTENRSYGITLTGYDYDNLLAYGEKLKAFLSTKKRVSEPAIRSGDYEDLPVTEFGISYDFSALSALGISPYSYWESLYSPLYDASIMMVRNEGEWVNVRLESSDRDEFDIWNVNNTAVSVGNTKVKLSNIGNIIKEKTGLAILRKNQAYCINVKYNFIGPQHLAQNLINEAVKYMNDGVLPIGYKAEPENYRWSNENKGKYAGLICLVLLAVFTICSIYFNSLRYSLAILWMIPISFIGLFLAFGLTSFTFDKGGFAAFVMLSGITVNAGIYLISAWLHERKFNSGEKKEVNRVRQYIRSFNHKIQPISLTILSTVLGLIPFLFDGPTEVFWFSFAIGTISGLVFSVIALILFLPVFCISRNQ